MTNSPRTLRDEFAMAALPEVVATHPQYDIWDPKMMADASYEIADAMMLAREQKKGE